MSRLDKAPRGLPGPLGLAPTGGEPYQVPQWAAAAQAPAQAAAEPPPVPSVKRKKQGGYYAHEADIERARAAWAHTQLEADGYGSWSEFQLAAVMALTERMEAAHNGGRPFDPLPAGRVAHSKRSGS